MPIIQSPNGQVAYQLPLSQGTYPVMGLPVTIRDAVLETSTNLQVPFELAAQAALGVSSLACQFFIQVQCPSYEPDPVTVIVIAVLKSGGSKSPVFRRYTRAIAAFERRQEAEFESAMSNYLAAMEIWEDDGRRLAQEYREAEPSSARKAAIRAQRRQHKEDRPRKPQKREIRYEEISPQGLRDAMVAHHGAGLVSPDAGPMLNGMTMSQLPMLCGYWNGEDRAVGLVSGTRRPVAPCLTILAMVQESEFATFMKTRGVAAFGTGLLARTLFAFPQTYDRYGQTTRIDDPAEPHLDRFNQRVAELLNQPFPAPNERLTLKLSAGAKWYWKSFRDTVHNELICGDFSEDIKSFFRKIGQHAARLAALFHYFNGGQGDISPDAMQGAIAVCEWHLLEWIRVFTPYAPSPQQQDAATAHKLLQWLQEATTDSWRHPKLTLGQYTERELRNFSSIRGNPQALDSAIKTLHAQGQVAVRIGPKGGRIIFYPPWRAPAPAPFYPNLFDRALQDPTIPIPQTKPHHVPSNNGHLQDGSRPAESTNSTVSPKDIDCGRKKVLEVKHKLAKQAFDAF